MNKKNQNAHFRGREDQKKKQKTTAEWQVGIQHDQRDNIITLCKFISLSSSVH